MDYYHQLKNLTDSGKFEKDDFAVVLQPFMRDMVPPIDVSIPRIYIPGSRIRAHVAALMKLRVYTRVALTKLRVHVAALMKLRVHVAALTKLRVHVVALTKLRVRVVALTKLRVHVVALTKLRVHVAALTKLRVHVAALTKLRAHVAALTRIRIWNMLHIVICYVYGP